jgi:hypothetical protein
MIRGAVKARLEAVVGLRVRRPGGPVFKLLEPQ